MKKKNCTGCFFLEVVENKDHDFLCVKHGLEIFNPFAAGCKDRPSYPSIDINQYRHGELNNGWNSNKKACLASA